MKNRITIEVNTDNKEHPVKISKPKDLKLMTKQEFEENLITDINTLCEGLLALIKISEKSGFKPSKESLIHCMNYLQLGIGDTTYDVLINSYNNNKIS